MRAVVQRVNSASVRVGDKTVGEIDRGLLVYLGIAKDDGSEQVAWLADKIVNLRIFDHIGKLQPNDPQPDAETAANAKTTLSLLDIAGKALVISQFTLLADIRKGRRPSFSQAAEQKRYRQHFQHQHYSRQYTQYRAHYRNHYHSRIRRNQRARRWHRNHPTRRPHC